MAKIFTMDVEKLVLINWSTVWGVSKFTLHKGIDLPAKTRKNFAEILELSLMLEISCTLDCVLAFS